MSGTKSRSGIRHNVLGCVRYKFWAGDQVQNLNGCQIKSLGSIRYNVWGGIRHKIWGVSDTKDLGGVRYRVWGVSGTEFGGVSGTSGYFTLRSFCEIFIRSSQMTPYKQQHLSSQSQVTETSIRRALIVCRGQRCFCICILTKLRFQYSKLSGRCVVFCTYRKGHRPIINNSFVYCVYYRTPAGVGRGR